MAEPRSIGKYLEIVPSLYQSSSGRSIVDVRVKLTTDSKGFFTVEAVSSTYISTTVFNLRNQGALSNPKGSHSGMLIHLTMADKAALWIWFKLTHDYSEPTILTPLDAARTIQKNWPLYGLVLLTTKSKVIPIRDDSIFPMPGGIVLNIPAIRSD